MNFEVSVIIPLYNGEKHIIKCLKALENQKIKHIEVIIVDDCSTDDSVNVIKEFIEFTELEIVLLRNDKNKGPGASRNRALNEVRGKWVSFCDADDYYEDDYLYEMLFSLNKDSADIAFCNYQYVDKNGNKKENDAIKNLKTKCSCKSDWIAYSQMSLCRMVVRSTLLKGLRMPEIYHCEDAAIIPLILEKADRYTAVDKPLYNYCLNEESASVKRPNESVCREMLIAYNYIQKNRSEEFESAFEYLGVLLVLYGCTLVANKARMQQSDMIEIIENFEKDWPCWYNNRYICSLTGKKSWYLKWVKEKKWFLLRLYADVHYFVVHFFAK